MGDGFSVAWRILDAQYWGVPQRRRRIFLVADFAGTSAAEILFKREGLQRNSAQSRTQGQTAAGNAENCAGADDTAGNCLTPWDVQSRRVFTANGVWPSIYGGEGGGHGYICYEKSLILDDQGGQQINVRTDGKSPTLRAEMYGNIPCVMQAAGFKAGQSKAGGIGYQEEVAATLSAQASGTEPSVAIKVYDARGNGDGEVCPTITGDHNNRISDYTALCCEPVITINDKATRYQGGGSENLVAERINHAENVRYIVRRLTPTECARLQGFPDQWGHPDKKDKLTDEEYKFWLDVRNIHAKINGKAKKQYTKAQILAWYNKLHTDSAEYKMWGNGVALPCVRFVMQGIAEQGAKTMASLFDGSGGFPLASIYEGIKPIWCSEVEPYPIAVTCQRFGRNKIRRNEK